MQMQRAMKHILGMGVFAVATGGQSLAADLYPAPHPAVAYVAAAASPYWTGFYFGGNLGVGWSHGSFFDTAGNTFTPNNDAIFWLEAKLATTTNSGAALLLVSKQTSTGQAIITTPVTQPRASM
jgi:opacity protein-like surface antigen